MRFRFRFALLLIILLPLTLGLAGQPLAKTLQMSVAMREIDRAQNTGDLQAESAALVSILEYSPWRGDLWQRLGRLYFESGKGQAAVEAFEYALAVGQLGDQGFVWLAEALISTERLEEADTLLRNIASGEPSILIQAAALLRRNQSIDASIVLLEKAAAAASGDESITYQLGVLSMVSHPAAALELLRVVRSDPQLAAKAEFLAETIQFHDTNEVNEGWYIAAGQALSQVGEWDAAAAAFALATVQDPQNAYTWAMLAEAQQQMGVEGYPSLERAVALDPEGEMVNGLAGLYHRRQGNTEQALIQLQKALAGNPSAVVWQIEIGGTLADAGRLEDALEAYNAATEMDRGNIQAWVALAKFSLNRNYRVEEDGLPAARQLVLLEPRNPVYLDLLGTAYLTLGDLDSAERFFLQALALDPEEAAILIHLGQTSLYRGDTELGLGYLRRASAAAGDERLREMADRLLGEYGAK
jgi:tetratricopeptide (TPR) repeat protein